ncbi:hypothetical protein Tco_1125960 [Tanacetum coccineum]
MEETYHVTFSEGDEAISQSSSEGDEINFNESRSFLDDEFLVSRNQVTQCSSKDDYFPYDSISPEETYEFTIVDDQPVFNEADNLEPAEVQDFIINEPISKPMAGVTTRSRIKDSEAASAHECLYVNFLSEIEPKKPIKALEEEGVDIA